MHVVRLAGGVYSVTEQRISLLDLRYSLTAPLCPPVSEPAADHRVFGDRSCIHIRVCVCVYACIAPRVGVVIILGAVGDHPAALECEGIVGGVLVYALRRRKAAETFMLCTT